MTMNFEAGAAQSMNLKHAIYRQLSLLSLQNATLWSLVYLLQSARDDAGGWHPTACVSVSAHPRAGLSCALGNAGVWCRCLMQPMH